MQQTIVDAPLFADFINRSDPFITRKNPFLLDSSNFLNRLVATEKYYKGVFRRTTLASLSDGHP